MVILKIRLTGEVGLFSDLADVFFQNLYCLLYTSAFRCENPVSKKTISFGVFWLVPNVILIAFLNNVSQPYNRAAFKHDVSTFRLTVICAEVSKLNIYILIYTDLT